MKNIIKNFTLIVAFLFTATALTAQSDFITAKDFSSAIKDKNTVVISAQKEKNYKTSHVKNSIHIDHNSLYKSSGPEGMLKTTAELAKIFGSKGVSEKNKIVIYDDGMNKYSTRIYWILKYLGVPNVKIVHKDMGTWRTARIPLTKVATKTKATTFTAKVNKKVAADFNYVKANLNKSNVVFLDVRELTEFNGSSTKPVSKGHIPGAKNIEWKKVENDKGVFLSSAELTKLFKANGVTKDKIIVIYCGTSVRAGIVYVALKSLGYTNVKVYDGAYNEWDAKGGKLVK